MTPTLDAPAESSPAPVTEQRHTPTVEVPQGEARAEWLKTGHLPEAKPKADPATAKETSAAGDKPKETSPASEAGKQEQPKRGNADTRLTALLDDLREAGLTPAQLKTFKQDYKRNEAAPQTAAPEQTAKPADGAPQKPDPKDFEGKSWAEYDAAKDEYSEKLAEYKASQAIEKFRNDQQQETATREMSAKLNDASKRYGETAEATIRDTSGAIFADKKIPDAVKAVINDSPVLVDLLYTLGSDADALADFVSSARHNPGAAIRKAVLVEKLVMEELAKGSDDKTERGEDGKFKAPPEKKSTQAPPPPKEVSGRGAPAPDVVAEALKTGDARAAIDEMTRRQLAKKQGR